MSPYETIGNVTQYTRTTSLDELKANIKAAMEQHLATQQPVQLAPGLSTEPLADIDAEWIRNHVNAIMSIKDDAGISAVEHLSVQITHEHKGIHLLSERGSHVYLLSSGELAEITMSVRVIPQKEAASRYGGRNVCDSICEAATQLRNLRTKRLS